VPHRPVMNTDQSQDTTGRVATNDPPQSIYPDNPERVKHVFLLAVHCVCR
jgi:hypothetical protein